MTRKVNNENTLFCLCSCLIANTLQHCKQQGEIVLLTPVYAQKTHFNPNRSLLFEPHLSTLEWDMCKNKFEKVLFCFLLQKITTKNAFGLHLIDYMADILKQKDSELTNFKVMFGILSLATRFKIQ